MKKFFEKRGQKLARRFTRLSKKVGEESADHIKENLIHRLSHVRRVRLLVLEWSLLVFAIIVLSLVQSYWYSSSYATDNAYTKGGSYIEGTIGKVNSLNPLFATTSSEQSLSKLMFATLTTVDYSGHTGLGLAKSITMDDTGKIWTLKLRENLKWSDGEPLTNKDVIFTVDLIKNPKTNTIYNANLAGVEVAENEEGDLVFSLSAPNVYFSSALSVPIMPEHILKDVAPELLAEDKFGTNPVSCGPFTYKTTQSVGTDGEKIIYLDANPNYYGGEPMLDSFSIHAYLTKDDLVSALNSGNISATAELGSYDSDLVTNSSVKMRQTSLNYGVYAFINMNSELLKSKSLRQSIRSGINMTNLRSNLNGEEPLDYPLLDRQIQLSKIPELPEEDYLKSRDEIAKLLPSEYSAVRVVTINSGYLPTIANSLVEQLEYLGISATLETYDPTQDFLINTLRARNYDILVYEIGLGSDPDLMPYYHSSQATSSGYNLSNYSNPIVNDFIVSARVSTNAEVRAEKYEDFLEEWIDDVPAIGIYQSSLTYFVNKNVRTFSTENRLVYSVDRYNDVVYWASEKATKNRTP